MIPYIVIIILSVSTLYYRGKLILEKRFSKHLNEKLSKHISLNLKAKGLLSDVSILLNRMWSQSGHLREEVRISRLNFKHSIYSQSQKLITEIERSHE